jgi:KipI family sensor histidine kinase inhibitor
LKKALPRAQPLGDSAVAITLGNARSAELLRTVHATARALRDASHPAVCDVVPGYIAVAVFYDASKISYAELARTLLSICEHANLRDTTSAFGQQHEIPVAYDGPDLAHISERTGLSVEEVVERHTTRIYTVDLIGFVPGFAYLSELDPSLRLSRRAQPRPRVPAGSVAIAGAQTGIYPLDTPGGWHILGHTDMAMFDPVRQPPAMLSPGDTVRFVRVD